ncbi:PFGI-1 class ICE element type IV pilus protein PilL2 [Pseudomonas kilonensis]|uniref:PFGI-1 class ICE element type IV pilus protein PilL2 n=1 Tax=Pseudomonas kilonensis TaxID=132476 RepID=UPI000463DE6C|nr:PilL N-terminal domain-containing protein [Pseudomonas kilonensis]
MPSLKTRLTLLALLNSLTIVGCQNTGAPPAQTLHEEAVSQPSNHYIPVQRYGRYTLVELAPEAAQQNLLLQVIDINLPSAWSISVGDALNYILLRSGYRLCDSTSENAALFTLPLPAAHLKIGPMELRDALQMLAGPAWSLQTHERLRQICFIPAFESASAGTSTRAFAMPEATR